MQALRFEDQVSALYSQRGNQIEREVKRSEGISDLFVLSSKGEKWIVRCVNLGEVNSSVALALIQLMQSERAQQGAIITCGIINPSVAQLVKGKPIHLVNGQKLQDYLDRLQPQPQHSTQTTQQPQPIRLSAVEQPTDTHEEEQRSERACPFCGESILAIAKKCKHCGEFLDDSLKKPGKAMFKASSKFIGLLASYHIMDANKKVLAKLKPGASFEVAIPEETVMYVKYAGGLGGTIEVQCHAHEVNRFSITKSQSGMGCVVSRVDVIDSDA